MATATLARRITTTYYAVSAVTFVWLVVCLFDKSAHGMFGAFAFWFVGIWPMFMRNPDSNGIAGEMLTTHPLLSVSSFAWLSFVSNLFAAWFPHSLAVKLGNGNIPFETKTWFVFFIVVPLIPYLRKALALRRTGNDIIRRCGNEWA